MKKNLIIVALFMISFPLLAMDRKPVFTQERYKQAYDAFGKFYSAIRNCEPENVSSSLDQIMELRKQFSFWDLKSWWSENNDERYARELLFNDGYMIVHYFNMRNDNHWPAKKPAAEWDKANIIEIIKNKLGYSRYVECDHAQGHLMTGILESDPVKVKQGIERIRKVRSQFSLLERWGITLPPGFWGHEQESRRLLFNNYARSWEIFKALSQAADKTKDPSKIKDIIQAVQEEYNVQSIATRDSDGPYDHSSTFLRSAPALLEACYRLKTPMNSKKLLEDAKRDKQNETVQVILQNNPELRSN